MRLLPIQVASTDLMSMGIRVISYTINEVTDDEGYLKALGKPRTAEVKRDADIGNAEAKRDAGIEVIPYFCFWNFHFSLQLFQYCKGLHY